MSLAGLDDFQLLDRWVEGDRDAGGELIDRNVPVLHRFFRAKVGEAADDLVQQTLLACQRRRDRVDRNKGSFRSFLLGIARLELLMFLRKHRREDRAMGVESSSLDELAPSPALPINMKQERKALLRAMRRIPLDLQLTLELYYWEECSVDEVASILEIPSGTVKSRLSRGRAALKDALANHDTSKDWSQSTTDNFDRWSMMLQTFLERREDDSE